MDLYSDSLRELTLDGVDDFDPGTYEKIVHCAKLRRLTLYSESEFDDRDLERVLFNAPDLEYLDLQACAYTGTGSFRSIKNLRHLRRCVSPSDVEIVEDTMTKLATISTLRHIDLGRQEIDGGVK